MVDHAKLDILWGVEAIAKEIGRTPRQANHMLASGSIKPAKKIAGRWCVDRAELTAVFKPRVGMIS